MNINDKNTHLMSISQLFIFIRLSVVQFGLEAEGLIDKTISGWLPALRFHGSFLQKSQEKLMSQAAT